MTYPHAPRLALEAFDDRALPAVFLPAHPAVAVLPAPVEVRVAVVAERLELTDRPLTRGDFARPLAALPGPAPWGPGSVVPERAAADRGETNPSDRLPTAGFNPFAGGPVTPDVGERLAEFLVRREEFRFHLAGPLAPDAPAGPVPDTPDEPARAASALPAAASVPTDTAAAAADSGAGRLYAPTPDEPPATAPVSALPRTPDPEPVSDTGEPRVPDPATPASLDPLPPPADPLLGFIPVDVPAIAAGADALLARVSELSVPLVDEAFGAHATAWAVGATLAAGGAAQAVRGYRARGRAGLPDPAADSVLGRWGVDDAADR